MADTGTVRFESRMLIDGIVLAHSPDDPEASAVKRAALEQLLEASDRENFIEAQWLEQAIKTPTTEENT